MKQYGIINWTIALYLAYILCSIFPSVLPKPVAGIFPILVLLICCTFRLKSCIFNPAFICGCLYSLGLVLASQNHVLTGLGYGTGGLDTVFIDLGFTLPAVAMGAVFSNRPNDIRAIRWWDIIICLAIIISICWMLPTILKYRSSARYIATMVVNPKNTDLVNLKFGYWNYTMCHIIALFFVPFAGLFKQSDKTKRKIFYGAIMILTAVFVLYIAITTTVIIMILAALAILFHWNKHYGLLGSAILLVSVILLIINIESVVDFMMVNYRDTDMYPKLLDFKDIINGGGSHRHITLDARADYQFGAIQGFLKNPFIGSSYQGSGGHSILLNRLGTTGIIGFIPFALMIFFIFRQWYKLIPAQSKFYYNLTWVGILVLLYNKNCFGGEGFTFISVILPCLCLTFNYPATVFPVIKKIKNI